MTIHTATAVPAGCRRDTQGRFVPEALIQPIDKTRDELVIELLKKALATRQILTDFKTLAMRDTDAFVTLSAEQYGVNLGGKKGNVTLYSFDGAYKIQIAIAENIQFDERLQAAKALVDECINEWAQNSRDEIKVLVQDAFKTDKEGEISAGRVLGLRRLNITDDKWQMAMKAIGESLQVVGSKEYIRFYQRIGTTDKYEAISLDVAAL
ncbi:MAG: DUF3164 family protein [Oxalobacteraceae bacterium]|nr:DUF3164 family protein [Oxalobacteraceae bacterium]